MAIYNEYLAPEVIGDEIAAKLPAMIKFAPLAEIDTTLVGRDGDTVTIPKYAYVGDADVVARGEAIPVAAMNTTVDKATVVMYGKGIPVTDDELLSAFGDPVGAAVDNLTKAIAAGIDNGCLEALQSAPLYVGDGTEAINADLINQATDLFDDEANEPKLLFIAPAQAKAIRDLRATGDFLNRNDMVDYGIEPIMPDVIGMVGDAQIVISKKIKAVDGKYNNVVVKPGALTIYMKRDVEIELDRDARHSTTYVLATEHCVPHLSDDSKVVRIITAE